VQFVGADDAAHHALDPAAELESRFRFGAQDG
jgi:hypothetical protein